MKKKRKIKILIGVWIVGILANLFLYKYIKARDEYLVEKGSMLKSRQIGEAADICYESGGLLFIRNLGDSLELVCGYMCPTNSECSKQESLLEELIREDYKRIRRD